MLCDYMLPIMTGAELVRTVRTQPDRYDMPILMLTGSDASETIDDSLRSGADDYLVKPVDHRLLLLRMTAALRAYSDRVRSLEAERLAREHHVLLAKLDEARKIQRDHLPALPLSWRGWSVNGALIPCEALGGDVYDVIDGDGDGDGDGGSRVVILVDVAGHGLPAALGASRLQGELRALVRAHGLGDAVTALNYHITRSCAGTYACVGLIRLDDRSVTIVNAGLPPIAVVRACGRVETFASSGIPPGLLSDQKYGEYSCDVAAGDRVVAMSDGLTEPFGHIDELAPCLDGLRASAWGAAPGALEAAVKRLLGAASGVDDATVLILEAIE